MLKNSSSINGKNRFKIGKLKIPLYIKTSAYYLSSGDENEEASLIWTLSTLFVTLLFFILVLRLWYLQVIQGEKLEELAEKNHIRIRRTASPRGLIIDRAGKILVDNRPSFDVNLIPDEIPKEEKEEVIKRISELLQIPVEKITSKIETAIKAGEKYRPLKLKTDISRDELAYIEANKLGTPLFIDVSVKRAYPLGEYFLSHILGYCREISNNELELEQFKDYKIGDYIGKSGIERRWEKMLRGIDGEKEVEENALGKEVKIIRQSEAIAGNNLILSIDIDLQRIVESAFKDKAGAVVVLDPRNGEIMALFSNPPYDLFKLSRGLSSKEWDSFIKDPLKPLINKAIQGQYPPGSVYKIVTAMAGLQEGVITPYTKFYCPGAITVGSRRIRCWRTSGHGSVNLVDALAQSCDVYFYYVGQKLGGDKLAKYAEEFGFNRKTEIDLEYEKSGLIPTSQWKFKMFKQPWYPGDSVISAIGQGFNLVTPLQVAVATAGIANRGIIYKPHIVKEVKSADGQTILKVTPEILHKLSGSQKWIAEITKGLIKAVNSEVGTAKSARLNEITVAGKTGTAQTRTLSKKEWKNNKLVPTDHAWFTAFAPAEQPEIVVTVLVEFGGHGGSVAAPIAKEIIKKYFEMKKNLLSNSLLLPIRK